MAVDKEYQRKLRKILNDNRMVFAWLLLALERTGGILRVPSDPAQVAPVLERWSLDISEEDGLVVLALGDTHAAKPAEVLEAEPVATAPAAQQQQAAAPVPPTPPIPLQVQVVGPPQITMDPEQGGGVFVIPTAAPPLPVAAPVPPPVPPQPMAAAPVPPAAAPTPPPIPPQPPVATAPWPPQAAAQVPPHNAMENIPPEFIPPPSAVNVAPEEPDPEDQLPAFKTP